ncbi:MAG: aldo/keto reductase [Propionibacteriaceae bacterium]|jgi:diketogulonate reductase-like aldo/keto reductase|nr:aldo/keto reductase [Propionibacteriaceae bacterium]
MSIPSYTLNDGLEIPAIGLGTYKLRGFAGRNSILSGLELGYRLIDSAFNYDNEGIVGAAVQLSAVPRDEIIVATKLPGRYHQYDLALAAIEESLLRMRLDYIDLMLIHWPNPITGLYVEAWEALVEAQARGLVRSVGVCNFLPEHVEKVVAATSVTPSINQIERHPFFPQFEHVAWDSAHGIRNQAWSPLLRGAIEAEAPIIAEIAQAYGKTPAQLILAWHVHSGVIPIPKAASAARQAENLDVFFDLSEADFAAINALARPDRRLILEGPDTHEEM